VVDATEALERVAEFVEYVLAAIDRGKGRREDRTLEVDCLCMIAAANFACFVGLRGAIGKR
jgi:hypothetical protein